MEEGAILYLVVAAVDSEGEEIKTGIVGTVTIDSVESSGDETTLTAGSLGFSLDEILSLRMKDSNV